ncbi:MAG TPA: aldolase catalytic domain-containing protein [Chitinispirillaceae bacterium]|nr:aldolase catalytic domain-containing protein [Chitinispirillaceae bacterium]
MFRPEIKVLDCSIRDGGLINRWNFSDEFVRETYKALSMAGVDYIELGYKASKDQFDPSAYGKWRFCDDDDVRNVIDGVESNSKLSCMVDIGRVEEKDIVSQKDSPFHMIRVACYVKDITKGVALCNMAMDKGYETTLNIMAVSTNTEREIDEGLKDLSNTSVPIVYVVDSFGAMYSEDVSCLVSKYKNALPGKIIGIHTHNNRQLAFANTVQAIIDGANFLDASVFGIGRGPGNCCIELLLSFLQNPKYKLRPVLKLIQEHYLPLSKKIEWGYIIPYMITGVLNEHPRVAISFRDGADKDDYVKFYDMLTTPEIDSHAAID